MSGAGDLTVGVDIGTTSVKAVAVDGQGRVAARAKVSHPIVAPEPELLEHDARRAWHRGPRRAVDQLREDLGGEGSIAGVAVAAMVPSLTAVDRKGVPRTPGLLYGDLRGSPEPDRRSQVAGAMPDAEGFFRWAAKEAPDAAGYWPAQAVATHALMGTGAIDTTVMGSLGSLQVMGQWNDELLSELGIRREQLPEVANMCEAAGTLTGSDAVVTGGTVDALCDQIVSGAVEVGDVLAIFGATLVIWVVTEGWPEVPGLLTIPHTYPDRTLVGGPSNAGALFVDWARDLLRGTKAHARAAAELPVRRCDPRRVPVWLPYLRGERAPFDDPSLRSSLHGLHIGHDVACLERAAYEASGFVIRRMLEMAGVEGRRVVASGGGSRVPQWMAAVADATGLPVDPVAVPEGAALGAAWIARMAAGLESALDGAQAWAGYGSRTEPDPVWVAAAGERFRAFEEAGPSR